MLPGDKEADSIKMKYFRLTVIALTIIAAQAQEPVLYGNDATISKGILVDSPNVLLSWGEPLPDNPAYHLKIRRIMKNLTVAEWDTVTIFHVPNGHVDGYIGIPHFIR
jgi:hypothetical protein